MSRYRNTMSELLKQVRGIKEQDEKDHEISMARGELEAIADKATQLASASCRSILISLSVLVIFFYL